METQNADLPPLPCPVDSGEHRAQISTYLSGEEYSDVRLSEASATNRRFHLPTHNELRAGKREDLRWALRRHGAEKIAGLLYLRPNKSRRRQPLINAFDD